MNNFKKITAIIISCISIFTFIYCVQSIMNREQLKTELKEELKQEIKQEEEQAKIDKEKETEEEYKKQMEQLTQKDLDDFNLKYLEYNKAFNVLLGIDYPEAIKGHITIEEGKEAVVSIEEKKNELVNATPSLLKAEVDEFIAFKDRAQKGYLGEGVKISSSEFENTANVLNTKIKGKVIELENAIKLKAN